MTDRDISRSSSNRPIQVNADVRREAFNDSVSLACWARPQDRSGDCRERGYVGYSVLIL